MLYERYLTERALSKDFDRLICFDTRLKEALALKNLSVTVLKSFATVEVNESLLRYEGSQYCEAEVTVNSACVVRCFGNCSSRAGILIFSFFLLFLVSSLPDETLALIELVADLR